MNYDFDPKDRERDRIIVRESRTETIRDESSAGTIFGIIAALLILLGLGAWFMSDNTPPTQTTVIMPAPSEPVVPPVPAPVVVPMPTSPPVPVPDPGIADAKQAAQDAARSAKEARDAAREANKPKPETEVPTVPPATTTTN